MIRLNGIWGWRPWFLLGSLVLLMGCGEVGGSGQCQGVESTGACIRVQSVIPTYLDKNTPNVDAVRDTCINDPTDPTDDEPEPFEDHFALVTVSNSPLPGASTATNPIVTLQGYTIDYMLNYCPPGANCPDLNSLRVTPGQTVTINPNSSVEITLPFVELHSKIEFVSDGGSTDRYPSYTAHYRMTGTTTFDETIAVEGFAEFTVGNYNNCP